jgi:SecD/SecF fusion protein
MLPSRWKLATYALVILIGCLIAAPNLFTRQQLAALPDWVPKHQVTLGLDLKGGSHLVLELDAAALEREQIDALLERTRDALREARMTAIASRTTDAVTIQVADPKQRAEAERVLRKLISTVSLSAFAQSQPDLEVTTLPDGTIRLQPTQAALIARRAAAVDQSLEIVRRRLDESGVAEPTIQSLGQGRILLQLPGVKDPAEIRARLKTAAKLSFHRMLHPSYSGARLPAGYELLPASMGGGSYAVERAPMLQGDRLADAKAGFHPQTGQPIVSFHFDSAGARRFAEITRAHVGKPFPIVLDGKVLSAPVIQEPIPGGSGQISGSFTVAETTSLAALLRAGALPAPLAVIEERTSAPISAATPSAWAR